MLIDGSGVLLLSGELAASKQASNNDKSSSRSLVKSKSAEATGELLLLVVLWLLLLLLVACAKRSTSVLPLNLCKARYDSNACKFKAWANGELTGINAACCKLVTIVP